jgi:hypothetical protein
MGFTRVGISRHAAHFCNLNLTPISYSFWNTRRKVLKFKKFDEKRAITPRWVFQNCVRWCRAPTNMATVTKNRTYGKIAGFWVITQKPLMISEIWHGVKNNQHSKIYLPCNFEVNLITHLGVIALFDDSGQVWFQLV